MREEQLRQSTDLMRARGVDERAIAAFTRFYVMLEEGATGYIEEDTIEPLGAVQALADLEVSDDEVSEGLARSVVLKLNGGLGTSMGVSGPKSALPVRDGLTFLDIIAKQVLALRAEHDVDLPLVFMDSFRTQTETLAILERHGGLAVEGLPLSFLQSAEPKLRADDLTPVSWPDDPELEWCPPGHGDVYVALQSSGLLDTLRDRGFRYLFLSNADNLGAVCDPRIPAWMARDGVPYVAEVCERTRNDRKGGHLARRRADGRLVLRDSAQVAPGEEAFFADNERHEYFHVNNLWIDLDVLADELAQRAGVLELPIIVNRKTVDPTRKDSTPVIQIESSMGTAVEVFEGSQALFVPRDRFRPVKTTNELLLVRSDLYDLDDASRVVSVIDHEEPFIDLSSEFRFVDDFDARFPDGVPSIREARSLAVDGDVTFGRDVVCVGDVTVRAPDGPRTIQDGTRLEGEA
ncbi:UTP--glucose-1-phosphate uridylyltransferase [Knoellia subterranea]|uniref:UTP--glucose-1-phosphate uridylyltransferase n=1 Tax=Knoellia subterranea KCTC 19937 TaxID=1385521 RepID=A0A0A0JGL1_9MICO|nr:UTP--glucose-1-phosphate uridylyltransferase [Knoellia subterranea]KGN36510.1 UTP--glucose-1-phosphate uridylyltransferase [Knoellia subterranea KCTC 19937]